MTQFLPPNLLALFAPRDPIPYLPPLEKLPHEKHHNQPYSGIARPTSAERREKIERRQAREKVRDPHNDPNAQGDAFKTLFVARVVSAGGAKWGPLNLGRGLALIFGVSVDPRGSPFTPWGPFKFGEAPNARGSPNFVVFFNFCFIFILLQFSLYLQEFPQIWEDFAKFGRIFLIFGVSPDFWGSP
uniref:U1 small nuclear ribonucleoprotein of 70kDa N-terminal domain-containing protein n=1 Tax=Malurus cyaneus samueli TaxID=2593467 RepID=A0A8C5TG01_9PASS